MPVTRLAFLGFTQGTMQVVRMDENNLGLFLEQLSEGYEQKLKINQMSDVLKERADYLFAVYDEYVDMKLLMSQIPLRSKKDAPAKEEIAEKSE